MNLRVTITGEVKVFSTRAAVKASLNQGVESVGVDAKPSDLHLARVKSR